MLITAETGSAHGQILKPPGDAHHARTIPSVVHHLAIGPAEQVGAGLQSTTWIEALNSGDQSEAGLLEQIVVVIGPLVLLTLRDQVGQSEVLESVGCDASRHREVVGAVHGASVVG